MVRKRSLSILLAFILLVSPMFLIKPDTASAAARPIMLIQWGEMTVTAVQVLLRHGSPYPKSIQ